MNSFFYVTILVIAIPFVKYLKKLGKEEEDKKKHPEYVSDISTLIKLYSTLTLSIFLIMAGGLGLAINMGLFNQNDKEISSENIKSETPHNLVKSQETSTMANCVVCSKRVDYYQENTYTGHHFTIGGLKSSDVVCGLECDLKLRQNNERIINQEINNRRYTRTEREQMRDLNTTRDPDIKMPDFNK